MASKYSDEIIFVRAAINLPLMFESVECGVQSIGEHDPVCSAQRPLGVRGVGAVTGPGRCVVAVPMTAARLERVSGGVSHETRTSPPRPNRDTPPPSTKAFAPMKTNAELNDMKSWLALAGRWALGCRSDSHRNSLWRPSLSGSRKCLPHACRLGGDQRHADHRQQRGARPVTRPRGHSLLSPGTPIRNGGNQAGRHSAL